MPEDNPVLKKFAAVQRNIGHVWLRPPDGEPTPGQDSADRYPFARADEVFALVRDELQRRHLTVLTRVIETRRDDTGVRAKVQATFTDATAGREIRLDWVGEGDSVAAATTAGLKQLYMHTFQIPTSEIDKRPLNRSQQNWLTQTVSIDLNVPQEDQAVLLAEFGVKSMLQLRQDQLDDFMTLCRIRAVKPAAAILAKAELAAEEERQG